MTTALDTIAYANSLAVAISLEIALADAWIGIVLEVGHMADVGEKVTTSGIVEQWFRIGFALCTCTMLMREHCPEVMIDLECFCIHFHCPDNSRSMIR